MVYQFPLDKILEVTLVENQNYTDSDWKTLAALTSLKKISFMGVKMNDSNLNHVPRSITQIALLGVAISDVGIQFISENFDKLELINCDECASIGKGLVHLSKCKDLKYLRAVKCQASPRNDEWLNELTSKCSKLVYFEDDCTEMSDNGLKYLSRCKGLRVLYIPHIGSVSKKLEENLLP